MDRHAKDLWQSVGQEARDFYAKRKLSARDGRPLWVRAKNWVLAPLVLLVVLYSAFGIVFMVIPARLTTALIRGPRRLLRRFSRWSG